MRLYTTTFRAQFEVVGCGVVTAFKFLTCSCHLPVMNRMGCGAGSEGRVPAGVAGQHSQGEGQ